MGLKVHCGARTEAFVGEDGSNDAKTITGSNTCDQDGVNVALWKVINCHAAYHRCTHNKI